MFCNLLLSYMYHLLRNQSYYNIGHKLQRVTWATLVSRVLMSATHMDEKKRESIDFDLKSQDFLTKKCQKSISSNINSLLKDESICDIRFEITFENETREYPCVKFLFAAQSSVFRYDPPSCHLCVKMISIIKNMHIWIIEQNNDVWLKMGGE